MKKQALVFILSLYVGMVYAQDDTSEAKKDTTYWKKSAKTTLTFSQTTLTNWAAGGNNSLAFNAGFNAFAKYAKDRVTFNNSLELGYGMIDQGNSGFIKSDDKIIFTSKFGYKIKKEKKLFWSTLIDFKSQFYEGISIAEDGTESKISDFMAPGYLTISTGLEWEPNEYFSILYTPVTGKLTFVGIQRFADRGDFGVEPAVYDANGNKIKDGETLRSELGSFLKILFAKELIKNVNLETKLELFTSYDENFGNIDVNWQNALTMKVNDWLMTSFITQVIYDDDIKIATTFDNVTGEPLDAKPRTQYKQILGIGLTFVF